MVDKEKFKKLSKLIPTRIIPNEYWECFSKGYKKGTKYQEETFHDVALKSKRHNHRKMFNYAKKILLYDERIELDPFLQNILKKTFSK